MNNKIMALASAMGAGQEKFKDIPVNFEGLDSIEQLSVEHTCSSSWDRLFSTAQQGEYSKYVGSGQVFEDETFGAEMGTLHWTEYPNPPQRQSEKILARYNTVTKWQRPSELSSNPSLWGSEGVLPNGVVQGKLGDCWFLASCAAIAEHPERIMDMFSNEGYEESGIYEIRLYIAAHPVEVVIDDRLAILNEYGEDELVNAHQSTKGAFWLPMIEKAFAKASVNYINMDGGFQETALRTLTGMPVKQYDCQQQDDWDIIKKADELDYIMTATCLSSVNGLAQYHAYTLLSVHELQSGVKLVRMRNPWNTEYYNGPYSDGSSDWTDADKAEVDYVDDFNDGKFYMPFDDFVIAFPSYQVAMYKQDVEVVQLDQDVKLFDNSYKFMNPTTQPVQITVDYPFPQVVPPGCEEKNDQNNLLITFYEAQTWQMAWIGQHTGTGTFNLPILGAGEYKFDVEGYGNHKDGDKFTLSIYSGKKVDLTKI